MTREQEAWEKVYRFAKDAHYGQKRKYTGEDYITHPVEVSQIVKRHGGSLAQCLAALLHDVLEDTKVTHEDIFHFLLGLSKTFVLTNKEVADIQQYVLELTDVYTKMSYPELNRKCRKLMEAERLGEVSGEAQTIKYADLMSNTPSIRDLDPGFAKIYLQEKKVLIKMMIDGDPILRKKVMDEIFS